MMHYINPHFTQLLTYLLNYKIYASAGREMVQRNFALKFLRVMEIMTKTVVGCHFYEVCVQRCNRWRVECNACVVIINWRHTVDTAVELAVIFSRLLCLKSSRFHPLRRRRSRTHQPQCPLDKQLKEERRSQTDRQTARETDRRMKDGRQTDIRATSIEARYGVRTAEAERWGG